jgi:hypothetical protein
LKFFFRANLSPRKYNLLISFMMESGMGIVFRKIDFISQGPGKVYEQGFGAHPEFFPAFAFRLLLCG